MLADLALKEYLCQAFSDGRNSTKDGIQEDMDGENGANVNSM